MPDNKILSLVLRPVSSQSLTCLSPEISAPNVLQVQVPLRSDSWQPQAADPQMGSKWWSIQLLLGQLFSPLPAACCSLGLQGRAGEGEEARGWTALPTGTAVAGTWDRSVTAASWAAYGGLLATASLEATLWPPLVLHSAGREGPTPQVASALRAALLVWVLLRVTPAFLGPLLPGWQASVHREEKAGVLAPSRRIQSVPVETFDLQSFQGWVMSGCGALSSPGERP